MLDADETVVGWGMAQREPAAHRAAMSISLMFIPGIGQVLAGLDAVASVQSQRLVVLTSRRLLLLHADRRAGKPDGSGIDADYPLGTFEIEDRDVAARWWVVDIEHEASPRKRRAKAKPSSVARLKLTPMEGEAWTMRIACRDSDAAGRLVEALRLIAGEDADASPRAGPGTPSARGARGGMLDGGAEDDREIRHV